MDQMIGDCGELVHEIARESRADGVTLFLFDASASEHQLRYLFNLGLTAETNNTYQTSICRHDPFLHAVCRRPASSFSGMVVLDQPELQREARAADAQGRPYWDFIQRSGYRETSASIQCLAPDIYLVMGLVGRQYATSNAFSARPVTEQIERLFGRVSASVMRAAMTRLWDSRVPQGVVHTESLTHREHEIVDALCRGLSNKQIAGELQLSEFTIENHLRRVYRKHRVRSRTALIAALGRGAASAMPALRLSA